MMCCLYSIADLYTMLSPMYNTECVATEMQQCFLYSIHVDLKTSHTYTHTHTYVHTHTHLLTYPNSLTPFHWNKVVLW
jgi:hypothetical protein